MILLSSGITGDKPVHRDSIPRRLIPELWILNIKKILPYVGIWFLGFSFWQLKGDRDTSISEALRADYLKIPL
jgi:hypothetical protein